MAKVLLSPFFTVTAPLGAMLPPWSAEAVMVKVSSAGGVGVPPPWAVSLTLSTKTVQPPVFRLAVW